METLFSTLIASSLLAAAEIVIVRLVQRWMTVAPAPRPLGFATG